MNEEFFECPECKGKTRVIWDPNQTTREVDCIICRLDVFDEVVLKDVAGNPVLSKGRTDAKGNRVPVTYNEVRQVGCRYKIERGKGVK